MVEIKREISDNKLARYFDVTGRALDMVKSSKMDLDNLDRAKDFLDMAQRYYDDAKHFKSIGDYVLAFAALNYAHGWLDAGARIRLFKVNDDQLFTVDSNQSDM